ncbi:hypothetical protein SEPCBS57363_000184 [Sporothrix epigloea]|uniref:Autophagy-related protein 28 n=1 Tax=Sporothrix epigloea TaxID=1892477 RepID=A0ABP0D3C6_9PEZI
MAKSSFVSRFSLSRENPPMLPLHTKSQHHQPSEYDLQELSPKPLQSVLFSAADAASSNYYPKSPPAQVRPSSTFRAYEDTYRDRTPSSQSSPRQPRANAYGPSQTQQSVLFAGPPPPIARSILVYRDLEDRSSSALEYSQQRSHSNVDLGMSHAAASSIRLATGTSGPQSRQKSHPWRRNQGNPFLDGDSTWTILQRRERALQQELQMLLDAQAAGLLAGLGRKPFTSGADYGPSSDSGLDDGRRGSRSNTPSTESMLSHSLRLSNDRPPARGATVPVRQPRPKRLGLQSARAGLARNISLLSDLRAEEDTSLEAALLARGRALDHLHRLSERRSHIVREIETLETDEEEPLARELVTLQTKYATTNQEIIETEQRLVLLKHRKRALAKDIGIVQSKRESGLSGYKGALKEVDEELTAVLRRPPLQPLDLEALGVSSVGRGDRDEGGIQLHDLDVTTNEDAALDASAGLEFLQLLPERRTAEMANFWWENDMRLLEKRRAAVSAERAALEEGGAVWQETLRLVTSFEASLRKEMADTGKDGNEGDAMKKAKLPTSEERMQSQLQAMAKVTKSLRALVQKAEKKGWNLLICAIGAELEAFHEAYVMLRQALFDVGIEIEDDVDEVEEDWPQRDGQHNLNGSSFLIDTEDPVMKTGKTTASDLHEFDDGAATPKLAQSTRGASVDRIKPTERDRGYSTASEYKANDVLPDLLGKFGDSGGGTRGKQSSRDNEDDSSEDEVPPEFLSEHQSDDDGVS